jgi:hypothetical protein
VLRLFTDGWGNEAYAANEDYLTAVAKRALVTEGPVLECGSGLTTLLLGLLAGSRGVATWTFEDSPEWLKFVKRELDHYGIEGVRICHTPIRDHEEFSWYTPPAELPERFDVVVCDGPPERSTPGGRVGLVSAMSSALDSNTLILVDDAGTAIGKRMLARWEELGWSADIRHHDVGTYAVVSHRTPDAG